MAANALKDKDGEKERTIDRKAVVNVSDMPEELQQKALDYINAALDKWKDGTTNQEREVAKHVKQEFDKAHGPTWHCIFGRNFGAFVTFESKCFVYLTIGQHNLILWKHL
eukprot:NODE_1356_length_987_cov_215.301706_g944_i0.p3 GENE.NODE_1356_length_987_cov_215.301706_g944_i0~~NODE_1356_length_987_cov_215.301706_g944_i0.p3  ORF type:complete len:110 (-),score=32.64 NODE_1356_length_987_cov_215.301706_g944_i0:416-745(-)